MFTHTASFGDGCREAPGGEIIQPKIEPISEKIKYKMFHFMVDEGDLTIADGDALTRIQVAIYVLTCCRTSDPCTVEPLYNGQVGSTTFVHCREVVHSRRVH